MSETQVSEQSFSAADRPGHRLAEARKARGMSMEDVAAQLRLNVSTLQALENDDYSHLPPAAYVSGYLRGYARVLGLSEAETHLGTTTAPAAEPPIVGIVARSHTAQVQASDPRVRFVSYVVIGGLFLLSSAWWLTQREEVPPQLAEESIPAEPPVLPAIEPAAVPAPTAMLPTDSVGAPAAVPPTTAPAPLVTAVTPAPTVAPAPAVEIPPKPEVPPPPPLTTDMPQSKIKLEFSADCWVDVADAAGRQLAYDLSPAGRSLTLRGEAPFKVFFGYSPGVQVYFNDQLFDHRPFQRRETARFKLGTVEDNALLTEAQ